MDFVHARTSSVSAAFLLSPMHALAKHSQSAALDFLFKLDRARNTNPPS